MHAREQRAVMGAVSNTSSRWQRAVDWSVSGEIAESGDRRESGEGARSVSSERGERWFERDLPCVASGLEDMMQLLQGIHQLLKRARRLANGRLPRGVEWQVRQLFAGSLSNPPFAFLSCFGSIGRGGDVAEEGDVLVGVEAVAVAVAGGERLEDGHVAEKVVVGEEGLGHVDAVGLHGVPLPIVVGAYFRVVEVADLALCGI
ncbi:hypothetical protein Syun_025447 [Stephania yunnanensis]|uniref:Uncharacterized protein n=1 Tax=Stephania yunnanensis TaxID=152371 RepID=A0AAP0EX14_9MAGN